MKLLALALLFAWPVAAQELPPAPRPKTIDRKFLVAVGALAGAESFDMTETKLLLDRGGREYNLSDFGTAHPSTRRIVLVESGWFAGELFVTYELKKPHSWLPRRISRVLAYTWWVPAAFQTAQHIRFGVQDYHACRPSCGGTP